MTAIEDAEVYVGAVGILFTIETDLLAADITSATKREIHITPPTGAAMLKTGTPSGTKLTYISIANDFATAGDYYFQVYLEWASGAKHHGATFILTVKEENT